MLTGLGGALRTFELSIVWRVLAHRPRGHFVVRSVGWFIIVLLYPVVGNTVVIVYIDIYIYIYILEVGGGKS